MVLLRKKLIWISATGAFALTILFVWGTFALRAGALKPRLVSALADALNCDVTLDHLDVRLVPTIRIVGSNLSIRLRNRPDLPAFVEASRFTVKLNVLSMFRRHLDVVDVDDLHLNVPKGVSDLLKPKISAAAPAQRRPLFHVNHLITHDAVLNFVGREPNNRPLRFLIHDLDITDPGTERPMGFTSNVTNPFPEGLVKTSGSFGPWNRDDPTETPLAGAFDLPLGDLASIAGIAGHVAASGTFSGRLTEIHTTGSSRTSDFSLQLGGRPVAVTTTFDATIDGTTGDVLLDRVDAVLIKTPLHFTGLVSNPPGAGHDVKIAVDLKDGRIEDILPLVIASERPILIGRLSTKSTLWLPHGKADTVQRLVVDGAFTVRAARFTDALMQQTLRELSQRALSPREREAQDASKPIAIDVTGSLALKSGLVTMRSVVAGVPGAKFELSGTYAVGPETLNFTGTARLQASMSQAVGGFKSIFIKPFNGLFSENGSGAIIPLAITGTRESPVFGVRKADIFKKGK